MDRGSTSTRPASCYDPAVTVTTESASGSTPIRILTIDTSQTQASIALLEDDEVVRTDRSDPAKGKTETLAVQVSDCLRQTGWQADTLDLIAVITEPGSYTGIRAARALAQGLGLAIDRPVVGVTVTESLAGALALSGGRALWTAMRADDGLVYLDRGEGPTAVAIAALPPAPGPVAIAGNAAIPVAARLAARGANVILTDLRDPPPLRIARAARARLARDLAREDAAP